MKLPESPNEFQANCQLCCGLCCVALYCFKMDGFPEDKRIGVPCKYLLDTELCKIHDALPQRHMRGCLAYDCFGAGQYVTQKLFAATSWRKDPKDAQLMFAVFPIAVSLFQMRYYLYEIFQIEQVRQIWTEAKRLCQEHDAIWNLSLQELCHIEIDTMRAKTNVLLKEVIQIVTKPSKPMQLAGKSMKHRKFDRYDFSMQLMIGCDCTGCSFHGAVFLGADTRDLCLAYADVSHALFLSQGQVNAARGNIHTKLPKHITMPSHWLIEERTKG